MITVIPENNLPNTIEYWITHDSFLNGFVVLSINKDRKIDENLVGRVESEFFVQLKFISRNGLVPFYSANYDRLSPSSKPFLKSIY